MKKLFFAIAALAVMTGCNNDELVEVTPKQAIAFGNAFVDNATRAIDPSVNTESLNLFKVYGTVTGEGNTVNIYKGVDVKKGDIPTTNYPTEAETWWYDQQYTQYWIEGNTYKFRAIANDNGNATLNQYGMPIEIPYDTYQQKDLLVADYELKYEQKNLTDGIVKFTFNHLLSKVMFTFKNTITTNVAEDKEKGIAPIMYTYRVSDIQIGNAYLKGTYYYNQDVTWKCFDEKARDVVNFGHITNATTEQSSNSAIQVGKANGADKATSHNAMFMIPHKYDDLTLSFTIETLLNDKVINKENITKKDISVELKEGHSYNFIISKGNPGTIIKFALQEVNGWDTDHNNDGVENDETTII